MSLQEMIMSDTALPNSYRLGLFGEKYREGLAEGKAEGKAEGEASMLLRILEARGIAIDEASRTRIRECDSTDQLERWADNALSIKRIEELFI